MFDFLKRAPDPNARELEQLIADVAEYRLEKDFQLLYQMMAARNVFVPADLASLQAGASVGANTLLDTTIQPGEQFGEQLQMRSIKLRNKMLASVAATTVESRILRDGYMEMGWIEFLSMTAAQDANFYGALLQGRTSWVALDRERIESAIKLGLST